MLSRIQNPRQTNMGNTISPLSSSGEQSTLKGFVKTPAMADYILPYSHKLSRPIVKPRAKASLKNRLSRSQSARSARNSTVKYSTISLPGKLQNINTQK